MILVLVLFVKVFFRYRLCSKFFENWWEIPDKTKNLLKRISRAVIPKLFCTHEFRIFPTVTVNVLKESTG